MTIVWQISELSKLILELRTVLFGNGQNEPSSDACAQLTQEFFKQDVFRLLIISLPKLDLGVSFMFQPASILGKGHREPFSRNYMKNSNSKRFHEHMQSASL